MPIVYHLDNETLEPVDPEDSLHFHGEYLACTSNHKRVAKCYEAHNVALAELWADLMAAGLTDDKGRLCVNELTKRAGEMFITSGGADFDVCQMLLRL